MEALHTLYGAAAFGKWLVSDRTSGLIYEQKVGFTTDVEDRLIRRVRQTPHLSAEEANLFYSRFELDLEAGVGLMSGQGVRPKVMLQWSNDHGHTWSNEQWIECGPLGQFAWRAIWRRMGRARDMVFRVVISDPIPVTLVDATVEVSRGTS